MPAKGPKEFELKGEELRQIELLEVKVNEAIGEKFTGKGPVQITVPDLTVAPSRIQHEIIKRFRAAGWHGIERRTDGWLFTP